MIFPIWLGVDTCSGVTYAAAELFTVSTDVVSIDVSVSAASFDVEVTNHIPFTVDLVSSGYCATITNCTSS